MGLLSFIFILFSVLFNAAIANASSGLLIIEQKVGLSRAECLVRWEQEPKEESTSGGRSHGKIVKADGLAKNAWIKRCIDKFGAPDVDQHPIKPSKPTKPIQGTEPPVLASEPVENPTNAPLLPKDYQFSKNDELDLHGKSIKRAKELVTAFLKNAVTVGKKFVLIITGKGKHSKEVFRLSDGTEVGPIKYNFLRWYQANVFEPIKNISYARPAHGGEGAFYVQLQPEK
jgi:DNA-nicking Smr family endonuclease